MATRLCIKRAELSGRFSFLRAPRTFCFAAAGVEKQSKGISEVKGKKEKDFTKVLAYEKYRENVQNTREIFRAQYEKQQAKEKRRLEELNQGSFSPVEQHRKAVEDIRIYNENKEIARKKSQGERMEKMQAQFEKQKAMNDAVQLEKNREAVLKIIEESKSFVTMENLEEKIQDVLQTETNYNFALTADRRKILSTEPPNNLGLSGPGPAAYQFAGIKFRSKANSSTWKTRPSIEDELIENDSSRSSESSESSDDENDGENDTGENDTRR